MEVIFIDGWATDPEVQMVVEQTRGANQNHTIFSQVQN